LKISDDMDEYFMKDAIELAKISEIEGEVPVGSVIVKDNKIVGKGRNRREKLKNALFHAEILAINDACQSLNSWRLIDCKIYTTLEPCCMCAGAIVNSRIKYIIFGTQDFRFGAAGSCINIFEKSLNHKPKIKSGVLKNECSILLTNFFKNKR